MKIGVYNCQIGFRLAICSEERSETQELDIVEASWLRRSQLTLDQNHLGRISGAFHRITDVAKSYLFASSLESWQKRHESGFLTGYHRVSQAS